MLSGMGTKLSTFSLMAFSLSVFNFAQAKSVYVITDHHGNTVKAYKIQGNQFEYQTDAKDLPNHGNGPVGIDIDPDSEFLFITYEDSDKITLLNAKTMIAEQDPVAAPGATDLAGLVFDSTKQKLYTVKRQDNRLYAYLWDANTKILTLEGGTYKTLENIGTYPNGAYGLALDGDRFYVSDNTNTVHYYYTDSWAHLGTRDVGRAVADIEVDPNNGTHNAFLYCGALYRGSGEGHQYLVKHDLEVETNPNTEQDINTVPIGVAIDVNTGLVYVSVSNKEIRVYDCSSYPFVQTDSENTGGWSGPAGLCVPAKDVSYKPPAFYLEKIDVNEPNCVFPGDYITYKITFGPNGLDHNNVVITDYLPC